MQDERLSVALGSGTRSYLQIAGWQDLKVLYLRRLLTLRRYLGPATGKRCLCAKCGPRLSRWEGG